MIDRDDGDAGGRWARAATHPESCSALSAEYRKKATALLAHYHPIELDSALTIAEKLPIMQEWYHKAHTLLAEQPITMALIADAVAESKVLIRPGLAEMLARAEARGVPFIAYSAGLGNVVAEVLRRSSATRARGCPWPRTCFCSTARAAASAASAPDPHVQQDRRGERVDPALLPAARSPGHGRRARRRDDGRRLGMEVVRVGLINQKEAAEQTSRLPSYTSTLTACCWATRVDFVNELLG